MDSNDLATGGVAEGSDAVGQDATAMFGGNNNKKKSASAASSLYAEELVGEEFVKEMLGDALDAGSNKSMSVGHGDNNLSTAAGTARNGGSLVSTSSSTHIKTSSSSDNGRSEGLIRGGEEDMKGGTGNEGTYYGVGGIHGVRVSDSKGTSKEGKGTTDGGDGCKCSQFYFADCMQD